MMAPRKRAFKPKQLEFPFERRDEVSADENQDAAAFALEQLGDEEAG